MHSTVCTVIDLFMCVCHILLINYYYQRYLASYWQWRCQYVALDNKETGAHISDSCISDVRFAVFSRFAETRFAEIRVRV